MNERLKAFFISFFVTVIISGGIMLAILLATNNQGFEKQSDMKFTQVEKSEFIE